MQNISRQRDEATTGLLAHLLDRLKEVEDMDGSRLFDSCIVSFGTNIRAGHKLKNLPALVTGGAAAERMRRGEHIALPKQDTALGNLWLTLLHQAGIRVE